MIDDTSSPFKSIGCMYTIYILYLKLLRKVEMKINVNVFSHPKTVLFLDSRLYSMLALLWCKHQETKIWKKTAEIEFLEQKHLFWRHEDWKLFFSMPWSNWKLACFSHALSSEMLLSSRRSEKNAELNVKAGQILGWFSSQKHQQINQQHIQLDDEMLRNKFHFSSHFNKGLHFLVLRHRQPANPSSHQAVEINSSERWPAHTAKKMSMTAVFLRWFRWCSLYVCSLHWIQILSQSDGAYCVLRSYSDR